LAFFFNTRIDKNIEQKLIKFCISGNVEDVDRTVKQGADINYIDEDYGTPLIIAIKQMNVGLAHYLLGLPDILINQSDIIGQTPLIIASKLTPSDSVQENIISVITKLIIDQKGVDVNFCDQTGTTALMYAALIGNLGLVNILVETNADVNSRHITGNTVLHYAVSSGNVDIVRVLLESGARTKKNENGKTPADIATTQEIKDLLPKSKIGDNVKKYLRRRDSNHSK